MTPSTTDPAGLPLAPPSSPRAPSSPPPVRSLAPSDRPALSGLIARDGLFTSEEVRCALELIDGALASPGRDGDYRVLVVEDGGRVAGYVCYGPTPMTESTWDLY